MPCHVNNARYLCFRVRWQTSVYLGHTTTIRWLSAPLCTSKGRECHCHDAITDSLSFFSAGRVRDCLTKFNSTRSPLTSHAEPCSSNRQHLCDMAIEYRMCCGCRLSTPRDVTQSAVVISCAQAACHYSCSLKNLGRSE